MTDIRLSASCSLAVIGIVRRVRPFVIADIRKDFTERARKLSHAYELAQQALQ